MTPPAISGAATGEAAFFDSFAQGPLGELVKVRSVVESERQFGTSVQLAQYFLNGGRVAWVQRVAAGEDAMVAALNAAEGTFDVLCVPGIDSARVHTAADALCRRLRVFYIAGTAAGLEHSTYAAAYTPRLRTPAGQEIGCCGTVAGVYARMDETRGVWKAPAGTEAVIRGATPVQPVADGGALNAIWTFPGQGPVVWGARTVGAASDPEWKYVNVRRLSIFLERSIDQGTRWAVFEPNGEPLRKAVETSVASFLIGLWRQGAFQGARPQDAFFVRCTPSGAGLDIEVGFAPLRPAEFLVLRWRVGPSEPQP